MPVFCLKFERVSVAMVFSSTEFLVIICACSKIMMEMLKIDVCRCFFPKVLFCFRQQITRPFTVDFPGEPLFEETCPLEKHTVAGSSLLAMSY